MMIPPVNDKFKQSDPLCPVCKKPMIRHSYKEQLECEKLGGKYHE